MLRFTIRVSQNLTRTVRPCRKGVTDCFCYGALGGLDRATVDMYAEYERCFRRNKGFTPFGSAGQSSFASSSGQGEPSPPPAPTPSA